MGTIKSDNLYSLFEIAKINLKHNARLPAAVSAVYLLLIPVIVGTANLDADTAAVPMEMFVSLTGIVMLTPVFQPEENTAVEDLVSSKYMSMTKIHLIRTVSSASVLMLLIILFSVYLRMRNCDVPFLLAAGTLADALFLGSLGMLASSLCSHTVIAYMIPSVFYALNYGMGSKLKIFYLFSMTAGQAGPKAWLLLTGILFIAAAILWKALVKKFR